MVKFKEVLNEIYNNEEALEVMSQLDREYIEISSRFQSIVPKLVWAKANGLTNDMEFVELYEEAEILWDILLENELISSLVGTIGVA